MSLYSRVVWKDGMFLLPQHFQQEARSIESSARLQLLGPQPLGWGVIELGLNEAALGEGRLETTRCRAILPDGTAISFPDLDTPPPDLSLQVGASVNRVDVFLALPVARPKVPVVAATAERRDARYVERPIDVPDNQNPDTMQNIDVAEKSLRLLWDPAALSGQVALKITELERDAQGRFVLRRDYVPPCAVVSASPYLVRRVQEVLGRAGSRQEELTAKRRLRGSDVMTFSASDLLSLWLLHTLNLHLFTLRHLVSVPSTHPAQLYAELLRFFGALLTFAPSAPAEVPAYRHDDLGSCFGDLCDRVQELLTLIVREHYTIIPLKQSRNLWDGHIADSSLLERAEFYLVATGEIDRSEFERLPSACKIADSNRVESLARTANPGLEILPVPRPPAAVPVMQNAVYYRLRSEGPLWQEVRRTGQLGIFVPRAAAGLQLELVAVHEGARS